MSATQDKFMPSIGYPNVSETLSHYELPLKNVHQSHTLTNYSEFKLSQNFFYLSPVQSGACGEGSARAHTNRGYI